MASYIPVPRDLTKVKSKVAFNLTKRQLICFCIAAAIGVPTFFLLKNIGDSTFAAMGMMIVMMPLFFLQCMKRTDSHLRYSCITLFRQHLSGRKSGLIKQTIITLP